MSTIDYRVSFKSKIIINFLNRICQFLSICNSPIVKTFRYTKMVTVVFSVCRTRRVLANAKTTEMRRGDRCLSKGNSVIRKIHRSSKSCGSYPLPQLSRQHSFLIVFLLYSPLKKEKKLFQPPLFYALSIEERSPLLLLLQLSPSVVHA